MLLPATLADGSPVSEALAAANACCPSGTSLLHVAVSGRGWTANVQPGGGGGERHGYCSHSLLCLCEPPCVALARPKQPPRCPLLPPSLQVGTGNVAMVEALGSWAAGAGGRLAVDARGTAGLTALHVAALLPNSAAMRAALAGEPSALGLAWLWLAPVSMYAGLGSVHARAGLPLPATPAKPSLLAPASPLLRPVPPAPPRQAWSLPPPSSGTWCRPTTAPRLKRWPRRWPSLRLRRPCRRASEGGEH